MTDAPKARVLPIGYQECLCWVLRKDGVQQKVTARQDGQLPTEEGILVVSKGNGEKTMESIQEPARVLAERMFAEAPFKELVVGVSLSVPSDPGSFWGLWHIVVKVSHVFTAAPVEDRR